VDKVRLLHVLGIDDTNTVEVTFLSPDVRNLRHKYLGNVDLLPLLDEEQFEIFTLICGGMPGEQVTVPAMDVILNAICDPDTNRMSLDVAERVQKQLKIPIVNHPSAVRDTTRDQLCQYLPDQPGLRMPKTSRIRPLRVADVAGAIDAGQLTPPFLFRQVGSHGGQDLALVSDRGDLDELERFALDGRDFYVTDFVDFRSPDGLYRKYRVLVIEGVPYAKHMIASDAWNIHAEDRTSVMHDTPALQQEEEAFLRNFTAEQFPVFGLLASKIGLDYFGMDFGIDGHHDMVVFEANCCFRALNPSETESRITYHRESVSRVRAAISDLIRRKAGAPLR
jgi:glutathione synthase/RimK-type ligase-like ATP-grasp enzyme